MSREDNILVFRNTEKMCTEDLRLKNAIRQSVSYQKLILGNDMIPKRNKKKYEEPAQVIVSKKRSYEAASAYKNQKVCVHNFASATNPGGGVTRPLLAAKWILDKKVAPPMLFDALVEAELEEELKPELERLLEMKKEMSELGMAPKIQVFNDYIEREMPGIKTMAEGMEENKVDWLPLDELFLRVVRN